MKNFVSVFLFLSLSLNSQTWNLPPRNPSAMNGSQFVAAITNLGFTARENLIEQEILAGNVPSFYRNLQAVTSISTISGTPQSVTYYVTPDYLAVGTDTNYFLCPMSPIIATHIADASGCTLPTRKMVNDIYAAATIKLTPQPIPASGQMTTVPVFDDHNDSVYIQRHNTTWGTHPLGELTGGDKKDVVISNLIYNTASRVVIYGWHQSISNPIQPLSNVHSDTYMDYSHGIRLVQNAVTYNGTPTTVKAILQSSTLNPLLSDEGVISNPQYPYSSVVSSLSVPVSFGIKNNGNGTLSILVSNDPDATHYSVYTSSDGINFSAPQTLAKTNLTLTGLPQNQITYVKIAALNQTYSVNSAVSEVLAAVPSNHSDSVLIVNGFDRASAGNTYNFIIQHGSSVFNKGFGFSSCTNEAVQNTIFSLNNWQAVDWILGEESTANETFSTTEQNKVSSYLLQGGKLFVSGAEIGWDLDHPGSAGDKAFYNNYLKASYVMDSPGNQAATFYAAETLNGSSLLTPNILFFDDGTHGTYNVDYPDVIDTINGSIQAIAYSNNTTEIAGLTFEGIYNGGTDTAKLVYFAFPFETIYNANARDSVMSAILDFFFPMPDNPITLKKIIEKNFVIYPVPAKDFLFIKCSAGCIPESVYIYDLNGKKLNGIRLQNNKIEIKDLVPGVYVIKLVSSGKEYHFKFIKE